MSNELSKDAKVAQEASRLARKDFDWAVGRVYELLKLEEQLPEIEARITRLEMLQPLRDEKGRFVKKSAHTESELGKGIK